MKKDNKLIVGLTELHGIAKEVKANPPEGVEYIELKNTPNFTELIFRSHAKGVLHYFKGDNCDLIEAPLFPIFTNKPWIYTPARFSGATSFNIFGIPIPKFIRVYFIKRLMLRRNFLKLIFKSKIGAKSLSTYANLTDKRILEKVDVVYPCIRKVSPELIRYNADKVNFLFSGDFFRKGGAHVVDAFERLQRKYDNINLRICSLPNLRINNKGLEKKYKEKIASNNGINFGYVDRQEMLEKILPETDVFVSPTYEEAFGFALLEASAYGIPVISTNHYAIPEIIEHNKSGYLIDTEQFGFISKGKLSIPKNIPLNFHTYMNDQVFKYMEMFIINGQLRKEMGQEGLSIAQSKFSFEIRNSKMKAIYDAGLKNYYNSI